MVTVKNRKNGALNPLPRFRTPVKMEEAPRLLREGAFDISSKLQVNTDGGLMSPGHPLGATALAQIIEIYKQIRGEAGPQQAPGAMIGLAHVMGAGSDRGRLSIVTAS